MEIIDLLLIVSGTTSFFMLINSLMYPIRKKVSKFSVVFELLVMLLEVVLICLFLLFLVLLWDKVAEYRAMDFWYNGITYGQCYTMLLLLVNILLGVGAGLSHYYIEKPMISMEKQIKRNKDKKNVDYRPVNGTSISCGNKLIFPIGLIILFLFFKCCAIMMTTENQKTSTDRVKTQLDVVELMTKCEQAIEARLKNPASLDISWLSRKTKNVDELQVISFEFTATNSFGGRIKNNAECGFQNGRLNFVNIGPDI